MDKTPGAPDGYLAPAGYGAAELTEKRSRFIAQVWPVSEPADAMELIAQTKALHRDARHNCWCYLLRDGSARSSDDGEPQGTAGVPMLEVFKRGGVSDLCCVVTRYFGGVLLGPGGLARAYAGAAKLALEAAGISHLTAFRAVELRCPYKAARRIVSEAERLGGSVYGTEYGADVAMRLRVPEGRAEIFISRATLICGEAEITFTGSVYEEA
jgi:uncharacterized YigZ family protein